MKKHNIDQVQGLEYFNLALHLLHRLDYQEVVINYNILKDGEHVRNHIIGKCKPNDEARSTKLSTFIIDNITYEKIQHLTSINIDPVKKSITYNLDYPL